jgi:hypothetical protein
MIWQTFSPHRVGVLEAAVVFTLNKLICTAIVIQSHNRGDSSYAECSIAPATLDHRLTGQLDLSQRGETAHECFTLCFMPLW